MPHPDGSVDPLRDAKMLELELILADLARGRAAPRAPGANIKKANKPEDVAERALFLKMKDALEAERPLRELEFSEEERRRLRNYSFLSEKPVLLVVNLGEEQVKEAAALLEQLGPARRSRRRPASRCARWRRRSRPRWRSSRPRTRRPSARTWGSPSPGSTAWSRTSYALLGLVSFLTAGEDECRAWTIRQGTKAASRPRAPSTPTSSAASSAPRWWPSRT